MRRRLLAAASIAAALAMLIAPVATATPPDRWTGDWTSDPIAVTDICPFPFDVVAHQIGAEVDRYDAAGNLIGALGVVKEQDTFTANGRTLVGEWYSFTYGLKLDADGNLTRLTFHGIIQKVWLPDGTLFVSAGYVSFPAGIFGLTPQRGHSGDVDAFCAALAP